MSGRNMKDLQCIGLNLIIVSLVSMGLLFAWAAGIASGVLVAGYGYEPTIFWLSAGATCSFALLGLIFLIIGEIISFFQSKFEDGTSPSL